MPMNTRLKLKRSLETSSIKALPKIVKAPSKFQKALWTMALIIGITVVGYQLSNLLRRYLRYSTTINIVTVQGILPFPDVTLCNMDRNWTYNVLEHELQGNMSISHFFNELEKLQSAYNCDSAEYQYIAEIHSFAGYIQNTHRLHAMLEHLKRVLVVDCIAYPGWKAVRCDDLEPTLLQTNLFIDPMFGFCATYHFNTSEPVRSMKILVHVQESKHHVQQTFNIQDEYTHHTSLTGVRLIVHPPGTFPDIWLKSELILAGQDSAINLVGKYQTHLNEPYGNCIDEADTHTTVDEGSTTTDGTYGYACYRMCARDKIFKNCGCVNIYYATTEEERSNGALCGMIDKTNISTTFERMKCALKTEYSLEDFETQCPCTIPCQHFSYAHEAAKTNSWPHEMYHLSFYKQYIRGQPFQQLYQVYEEILALYRHKPQKAIRRLKKESLIRNQFAQMRILNHQKSYSHYIDTPLVSIEALFGNMGGLLNLWVGITFITVIEIVDLVHQLYTRESTPKERRPQTNGSDKNDTNQNTRNPGDEVVLATDREA